MYASMHSKINKSIYLNICKINVHIVGMKCHIIRGSDHLQPNRYFSRGRELLGIIQRQIHDRPQLQIVVEGHHILRESDPRQQMGRWRRVLLKGGREIDL